MDKKDYKKHLLTRKHFILMNPNELYPENPETPENKITLAALKLLKFFATLRKATYVFDAFPEVKRPS